VATPVFTAVVAEATDRRHRYRKSRIIAFKMDSVEEAVLLALNSSKAKKKRKPRKHWVKHLLSTRLHKGLFHSLYDDLRQDDEQFFNYFRMSKKSFDELLSVLEEDISGRNTVMRRYIPAEENYECVQRPRPAQIFVQPMQ
jgi:3'-phosphoadenosine 5'-phosphosulfate sulfotransferase